MAEWLAGLPAAAAKPLKALLAAHPTVATLLRKPRRKLALSVGAGEPRSGTAAAPARLPIPTRIWPRCWPRPADAVAATADEAEAMRLLRRMKAEAALLIALADIGGVWPVMRATRALTDLADTAVDAAARFLLAEAARDGKLSAERQAPSRRTAAAISCSPWARWAPSSSTIRAISISSCSTTPSAPGLPEDAAPAALFVRADAAAGEAAAGAHRRRLRVPHRSAAAPRSGLDRDRDLDRGGARPTTRASGRTGSAPP